MFWVRMAALMVMHVRTKPRVFWPLDDLPTPEQLLWAVRVRWLVIGGFFVLAALGYSFGIFGSILPCVRAAAVGTILNAVNDWSVRRDRRIALVTAIAIPCDHVLITYVVVNTGGVQSPFLMMYVVAVLATAILVGTAAAAVSAALAVVVWLAGIALFSNASSWLPGEDFGGSKLLYHGLWAAFLLYCLALLVYLGGYVARRLRSSERNLVLKNRELQDTLHALTTAHAELTAAYERLTRTEAHLIQSEKMRSLGQLVAGVAHELSNPISFVSANVEHLRRYIQTLASGVNLYRTLRLLPAERDQFEIECRQLRLDEALTELPKLLEDCEEGARRTKQIVNELRSFARTDRHELWERVDIHRGINSTLALLAHRLKDRITVHRDFGDLPEVECLSGPLNQVFMNLLANAADAIRKNGHVWISTRLTAPDRAAHNPAPAVSISIRDDGVGIAPDVQAKIFDPFFTTKTVGQGTGMGLSVSYGIIGRHGGTLAVESVVGRGATFTITLPVTQSRATPPTATS